MGFFSKIENGWSLGKLSLKTIHQNKSLLLFPMLSTVSLVLIIGSFLGGGFILFGDRIDQMLESESMSYLSYVFVFLFYLVNYFIVVFFNTALLHCAVKTFYNEETSVSDGISFASSKLGKILGWTIVSATVGTLLEALNNMGKIGEIATSLIGIAWSLLTFFVVPVLVFEDKGVIDSIKDSGRMMKAKWGESLTMNISFGIFQVIGIALSIGIAILLGQVHIILGIVVGVLLGILVLTVFAAARTIFTAAIYNQVNGKPTGHFNAEVLDSAFITKK